MLRIFWLLYLVSCAYAESQPLDGTGLRPVYAIPSFDGVLQPLAPLPRSVIAKQPNTDISRSLVRSRRTQKTEIAVDHTKNALDSVSANTPANLAQAIRTAQECYQKATEQRDPAHFRSFHREDWEALQALQTAYLSVTNQFVGYLPPNVLNSVIQASEVALAKSGQSNQAREHLNDALKSVGASTFGESATIFVTLTLCLNNLVMDSKSRQAVDCLAKSQGPVANLSNMVNGAMQQFFGYLPPNLVIDAQKAMQPYLRHPKQKAAAARAMQELFELSSAGPVFVTCYQEMQRCAMEVLRRSRPTACKVKETCAALSS